MTMFNKEIKDKNVYESNILQMYELKTWVTSIQVDDFMKLNTK